MGRYVKEDFPYVQLLNDMIDAREEVEPSVMDFGEYQDIWDKVSEEADTSNLAENFLILLDQIDEAPLPDSDSIGDIKISNEQHQTLMTVKKIIIDLGYEEDEPDHTTDLGEAIRSEPNTSTGG